MNAEIELKLFFLPEFSQSLIDEINRRLGGFQADIMLTNGYFDTPELQLRRWDMGLRVRGFDGKREQTIKTAGKVVGGIHSRPEYNVPIAAQSPALALFPDEIWPDGANLDALQSQLGCIFQTDFRRLTWLVSEGQSQIEIALDRGSIHASGKQMPICELELELKTGVAGDLLTLAGRLISTVPMRLGNASKAQRGYRLAGMGKPQRPPTAPAFATLGSLDTFDSLKKGELTPATAKAQLEYLLARWQWAEEQLVAEADEAENRHLHWNELGSAINGLLATLRQLGQSDCGLALADYSALVADLQSLCERGVWEQTVYAPGVDCDADARLLSLWRMPAYGRAQLALVQSIFAC